MNAKKKVRTGLGQAIAKRRARRRKAALVVGLVARARKKRVAQAAAKRRARRRKLALVVGLAAARRRIKARRRAA